MKIKPEHVKQMKDEILSSIEASGGLSEVVRKYETGNFSLSDKVKDLNTRFVWDMLWLAGLSGFLCENIYAYANDTHITTALKSFLPQIERRY